MAGSFTLFEHRNFRGRALTFELDDFGRDRLHSLENTPVHDKVSSVTWNLDSDEVVRLYEHDDGTGRSYGFGPGAGADASTDDDTFVDCATTWRWTSPNSVLEAFDAIQTVAAVSRFARASTSLTGGHLQGVGRVDPHTLAISTSGDHRATVMFVRWEDRTGTGDGEIITTVAVGQHPLDHAGGLQIADDVLAVGVEDNGAKDRSRIVLLDVADPASTTSLDHLAFDRPADGQTRTVKRWTAGAVGLTKTGTGHLLVVGSWDSADLDFYRSTGDDLRSTACRFRHVATWSSDRADRSSWVDDTWASYQSLNLVTSDDGRQFVIGGNRNARGEDWIDLYEIELALPAARRLTKVAKKHLTCREGASFRWSGGIAVDGTLLHAIATERDLHRLTTVNIFSGRGDAFGDDVETRFVANTRSRRTHSLRKPCPWVDGISLRNRRPTDVQLDGYDWCSFCFPARADG